ncbi:formylglycine-generating enzyme family protein [Candidatus Viadribacter manganicus]|uniref:Sulfatase-modifying factor enzyme-like domain-containing protein n=1 Tax=Candidatus Viadribacter manganicus TaxID=1759059 RepID=A0A1B1ALX7_9PROT|nr:formylglycine-generating enzyme family protein [Candidatus Viadribacter manganicus]ANP47541.1 hypothetical protein ATE48_17345 [Candidatus Viadribacter manganicus]
MVREINISSAASALGAVRLAVNVAISLAGLAFVWLSMLLIMQPWPWVVGGLVAVLAVFALVVFGLRSMNLLVGALPPLAIVAAIVALVVIVINEKDTPPQAVDAAAIQQVDAVGGAMGIVTLFGGLAYLVIPFLWAYVRYASLSPAGRMIASPMPRVRTIGAAFSEVFGSWRGFRRPLPMRVGSSTLLTIAAILQSLGAALTAGLTLTFVGQVAFMLFPDARPQGPNALMEIVLTYGGTFGVIAVLSWIPLLLASAFRNAARGLARQGLAARVKADERPPTLFLRSFQDDQVGLPRTHLLARGFAGELGTRRIDHILVEEFSRYAPVVALGKPGEKSLPFGAARVYSEHENWQATVHELAAKSNYIVLIADPSPGVAWEIENMLTGPYRDKVLLICAPRHGDLREVEALRNWPPIASAASSKGRIIAAYTARDGSPVLLSTRGKPSAQTYQVALQAFFRERAAVLGDAKEAVRAPTELKDRGSPLGFALGGALTACFALGLLGLGALSVRDILAPNLDPGRDERSVSAAVGAPLAEGEFDDCEGADWCPRMVVIQGGSFVMGSPSEEAPRWDDEYPQHLVTVPGFAVGKFEVTFNQWEACVRAGGCTSNPQPSDEGWGRGDLPVINVSWSDAQEYVRWLSQATGENYRLLSEAEWEYVALAGAELPALGEAARDSANLGKESYGGFGGDAQGADRWLVSAPVGSFAPNAFGVHDTMGNVQEWVEDCYNGTYDGAPTDGAAWTSGDCSLRVMRGGAWSSVHNEVRASSRTSYSAGSGDTGFRVARSMPQPEAPID